MVVIAGDASILGFGRRDASAEVDRLYRRHADEVLRYVLLVLRSRTDAEDVVQATFIRALRALSRGERVQKPRNWLIKIAHNECRRALAARSRRAVEVELEDVPVEPAESGRAESLRAALSQLAPKQREALILRELEGRSYTEIATTLELSESAVETLLFRARRAVREQLEDVLGCDAACALIEQETLGDQDRRLLRAHIRACAACATAERQARGRKSALRRIASTFGLPGFLKTLLGKVLAVAVTASAVGITGAAIADQSAKGARHLPPPPEIARHQVPPVVAPRHATTPAAQRVARVPPALGRPTRAGAAPLAHRAGRAVAEPEARPAAAPATAPAAQPEPAASPVAPAATAPRVQPALPKAALPKAALPKVVASLPGELAVPSLTVQVPAVTVQVPAAPVQVQLPAVTLGVPSVQVPPVQLPPVQVPPLAAPQLTALPVAVPSLDPRPLPVDLPAATPQVPGLPSVP